MTEETQIIKLLIKGESANELGKRFFRSSKKIESSVADCKIIKSLSEGLSMKEIGKEMFLSPRTIENRVQQLKKLFEAKTIAHLVTLANK